MKLNLFKNQIHSFGLDISSHTLKVVEFNREGKHLKLTALGRQKLAQGMVADDNILDSASLGSFIAKMLTRLEFGNVTTPYVSVSLPESKCFIRIINIPQVTETQADQAVRFESESYIPIPIDQVYLDWQSTGRVVDGKMEVLIAAAPKEVVDKYLSVIEKAGLLPVSLEVESQSMTRALFDAASQENVLVVDIGTDHTNLVMIEQGTLQFSSSIPVGGSAFTNTIAKFLGITSLQAEEIKQKVGFENTTDYPNIKVGMMPVLNNLSAEISNVLKFHNEHSTVRVEKVLLSGGGSKMLHLKEYLQEQFTQDKMTVTDAIPWVLNKNVLKNDLLSESAVLDLTTVIGLATRYLI